MRKVTGFRLQLTVLIGLLLLVALFLLPTTIRQLADQLPTVYAESCLTQTTNPRADGLISVPDISGSSSKFGNTTGTCVVDQKAAFATLKIPTYEDLLSLYFTQSKLGPTQKKELTGPQTQDSANSPINLEGPSAQPGVIVLDSASSGSSNGTASLSWQHTVGTGPNLILLVGVSIRDLNPPNTVSDITYAGQPLTKIGRKSLSQDASVEMWYLIRPPTGENTVTVTLTGAVAQTTIVGGATSWTEVNLSNPIGAFVSNGNYSYMAYVDVTSAAGEVVVDVVAKPDNCTSGTITSGPGQTQQVNRCQDPGQLRGLGSSEPGAATVRMSWAIDPAEAWAIGAVPLKPAPVP